MEKRVLPSTFVDPTTVNITDHVREGQKVYFQYFRDDEFWYKTEKGLLFSISLAEAQKGKATFKDEDKALYYMRWIRKYVESFSKDA